MSVAAMNWALKARTDGVSAQCVLLVIADSANERGVSFHADPDYIAERTRQSRATVFRRLKEMEAAGVLVRVKRFTDDGGQIYEIRLRLDAEIDYDRVPGADTDAQDIEAESQGETEVESQSETPGISPVRQSESHSCDYKNPSKNPEEKIPPNPPRGALRPIDPDTFEQDIADFATAYPIPITNLPKVRAQMAPLDRVGRQKLVTAARGYGDFLADCQRKRQRRAARDAHRWIASGEWQGYVMAGERVAAGAPAPTAYLPGTREGRAILALAQIARYSPLRLRDGHISFKGEITPQLLALADIPADAVLVAYKRGSNNFGSWNDFIRKYFAGCNLAALTEILAPYPFPPRADGTIYSGSDPPGLVDGTLATADDLKEFAKG